MNLFTKIYYYCSDAWAYTKKNYGTVAAAGLGLTVGILKRREIGQLIRNILKRIPPSASLLIVTSVSMIPPVIVVSMLEDRKRKRFKQESSININDLDIDLTRKARQGLLGPFEGREDIVDRAIQGLLLKDKPNILFVGPPGTGKTALVEAIAQRIAEKNVPKRLQGKRIVSIKMSDITANAVYVGEREGRVAKLIQDLIHDSNTILFIDEVHTIMNGGVRDSQDNFQNNLKPHLARGDFQMIGCTTDEESWVISKDSAFARRFKFIKVPEPNNHELLKMILSKIEKYEEHHGCTFPETVIKHAIIKGRDLPGYNPDKTLSLIDQAGARAAMRQKSTVSADDVDAVVILPK